MFISRQAVQARRAARKLGSDLRALADEEFPHWVYALRTLVAMLLALLVAFRLDLSSPASAAVTVVVVSLPQSGMVLEKSFYRLLATITGALVTLLLVMLFAQQRDLFIVMVALWLGLCAALSAQYRNFQSYGWALAGYTACLIGYPAYMDANHAFDIAVDRVSIVALGVLCGGLVNATLFPRLTTQSMVQTLRRSFYDFTEFVAHTLQGYKSPQELQATQRQFLQDLAALENARASSFFEDPETRIRSRRLRRFISQFMLVSTTAHVINRLRNSMLQSNKHAILAALEPLNTQILQALQTPHGKPPAMAAEAVVVVEQLNQLLARWPQACADARAHLSVQVVDNRDDLNTELDSALVILHEFISEASVLANIYADLPSERSDYDREDIKLPGARASVVISAIAGLRTALAFLAVCVFWILSSWPDGFSAALLSAIACTLFVNAPTPARSVRQMSVGFVLGFIACVLCFTFVLPLLDGMLLLAAGLAPFLLLGAYLMSRSDTVVIGSGYGLMFLASLSLTAEMHYDVIALINGGLAQIAGVLVAATAFSIIFPTHTGWHARRIQRSLWRELQITHQAPLAIARHKFESGVRDLGLQWIGLAQIEARRQHRLLVYMVVLETGRAIWSLREILNKNSANNFHAQISTLLEQTQTIFNDIPKQDHLANLQTRCAQLLAELAQTSELAVDSRASIHSALQMLLLAVIEQQQLAEDEYPGLTATEVRHAARA